jgi:hypothetical protein
MNTLDVHLIEKEIVRSTSTLVEKSTMTGWKDQKGEPKSTYFGKSRTMMVHYVAD